MQTSGSSFVLRAISSMATKSLLLDLAQAYAVRSRALIDIESVGGVDAAKRVQAGEVFDMVLLASDAIDRLITSGHVQDGSRVDWVRSPIAVAVQVGVPRPDLSNEAAVREAVLNSPTLSYSTGPSGVYLEKLFERWGISEQVKSRVVVPPPGTPVGALVASGKVALGFQQLSELISVQGLDVVGNLPNDVAYITTFSSGIPVAATQDSARQQAVQAFLQYLASAEVEPVKQKHGMTWAV